MPALTKPCPPCKGTGTVPRERRKQADGTVDPLDILGRFERTCDGCGGLGAVPLDPKAVEEKRPSFQDLLAFPAHPYLTC